ncbi:hypothetical protein VNI00_003168 [Paramarasmius palmivorus]|uniref:F-box domain-containing protein n=1 Tax=Paramarasmius palmivorus TaxID=297713 RepID=A0AAW0DUG7_9AGAR
MMEHDWQSPYDHLFETNYIPSPVQIKEIKELVRRKEEELRILNKKIVQLQVERDKLQSFVDGHHALLSPARRLPRDVLAEIFLQCLPTVQLPVCSATDAPLLLTTICRSWREIAVTTPRLWRAIHFVIPNLAGYYTLDDNFRSFFAAQKEGLELWLNRSCSVLLTISLYLHLDTTRPRAVKDELQTMYIQLLDSLLCHSTRWEALYFKGLPASILSALRDAEVPRLHTFLLENSEHSFMVPPTLLEAPSPIFSAIARAPSLHALHIRYSQVDFFTLPVRWYNLTDLTLYHGSITSISTPTITNPTEILHRLAQTCPSLCTLKLSLDVLPGNLQDVSFETQVWPQLSRLSISFHHMRIHSRITFPVLKNMFNTITTPTLSHLALIVPEHLGPDVPLMPEAPFLDMLIRSKCHLTSLDLDLRMTDKALIDCLQCMPSLTAFQLTDGQQPYGHYQGADEDVLPETFQTTLSDTLFRVLTPTTSSTNDVLCSKLETVSLRHCALSHADDLIDFVLARSGQNDTAKLKSFKVVFRTGRFRRVVLPPDILAKGQSLMEGSNIDIAWHSLPKRQLLRSGITIGMPDSITEY